MEICHRIYILMGTKILKNTSRLGTGEACLAHFNALCALTRTMCDGLGKANAALLDDYIKQCLYKFKCLLPLPDEYKEQIVPKIQAIEKAWWEARQLDHHIKI